MCTGISYTSSDKHEFLARTQEYNIEYDYVAAQFGKKYEVKDAAKSWLTMYSVLGVSIHLPNSAVAPLVIDGVNEHGLACSTQYFADDYCYATRDEIASVGKMPIYAEQFIFFILSMCEDIKSVKEILETIAILDEPSPFSGKGSSGGTPQHFLIKDSTGETIVVEPSVKLGFKVFGNEVGVMTNNPTFDWHLSNLRNYVGASNKKRDSLELKKLSVFPLGNGSGLLGIPGDFTASSRFIKAVTLLNYAEQVPSNKAINLCYHILSMSDIPKGVNLCPDLSYQYTQYTSVYNQTQKTLCIKLYENLAIQKIEFSDDLKDGFVKEYNLIKEEQFTVL